MSSNVYRSFTPIAEIIETSKAEGWSHESTAEFLPGRFRHVFWRTPDSRVEVFESPHSDYFYFRNSNEEDCDDMNEMFEINDQGE